MAGGDGGRVTQWSSSVIKEFREMKMQPLLERALSHKEILGA
jgi:hypothetical protein